MRSSEPLNAAMLEDREGNMWVGPQACLQQQNDRFQLLLNLTNHITSNLELKEVLRGRRECSRNDAL